MKLIDRLIAGAMFILVIGCSNERPPERDIALEVAASMDELFNLPAARGREVYGRYCSVCHGLNGRGDGFNAFNLDPRPRNFTDSSFRARLDTGLIQETIVKGGAAVGLSSQMPPWGNTLSEEDIRHVTGYVVHLSRQTSATE